MTQRGAEQVEKLQDEVQCPQCEYSLRGLAGDEVTCPECGQTVNIALLISTKWEGAWYKAPFYNVLAYPVAWGCFAAIVLAIYLFDDNYYRFDLSLLPLFLAVVFFVIWMLLIWLIAKRFGGSEAIGLTLLMHGILCGYLIGILGCIPIVIQLCFDLYNQTIGFPMFINSIIIVGLMAIIYVSRRAERFVGGRCVKRYLRNNVTS